MSDDLRRALAELLYETDGSAEHILDVAHLYGISIALAARSEPRAEGLDVDALRPLFRELEEADMANRVRKGDRTANLRRLLDAEKAVRDALAARSEPPAEGLRERVAALLSSSMNDGWNYAINAALDAIDGARWDDVLNAATPPAEGLDVEALRLAERMERGFVTGTEPSMVAGVASILRHFAREYAAPEQPE